MPEPSTVALLPPTEAYGKLRDIGLTLLVCLLWALCYPLITTAISYAPPLKFGAWRSLLAGLVLFIPAMMLGRRLPPARLWPYLGLVGFFMASVGFAGMFLAGGKITPGLATVLSNTQPLIATILALLFIGERIGKLTWLAMFLGFIGVGITAFDSVFGSGGQSTGTGVAFVMLGAGGVAVGNILLKKVATKVEALPAIAIAMTIGAIPLFIAGYGFETKQSVTWNSEFVLTLLVLSVAGTALPLVLWLSLLKRLKLTQINALTFTTPLFGLWIGASFFGERLTGLEWLGVVFIVVCVLLVGLGLRDRSTATKKKD